MLFAAAGLYPLGFVRLEGIKAEEAMGLGRLLTGMAFDLLHQPRPGMFGGRLGNWTDMCPWPQFALARRRRRRRIKLVWLKISTERRWPRRAEGKLVFVNFTGVLAPTATG